MDAVNLQGQPLVSRRDRDIWLGWVVYTILGYFILGAVTIAVIRFAPGGLLLGAVVGPLGMVVVALMQWFVLRGYIPAVRWLGWLLSTVLGQLVGMIMAVLVAVLLAPRIYLMLGGWQANIGGAVEFATALVRGVIFGLVIGFMQWLILRRYLQAAGWWVLAVTVAMAITSVISTLWLPDVGQEGFVALPLTMSVTGVIVGAITGLVLTWLLRKPLKTRS